MSFVATNPEMVGAAADNLQSIGSVMNEQNAIVTGCIAEKTPAAADAVSALTAMQFSAQPYSTKRSARRQQWFERYSSPRCKPLLIATRPPKPLTPLRSAKEPSSETT
jgi:PE family